MVVGFIILCNLPVSYLFLKLGCDANVTMFVGISISMVALCARVILLSALFSDIKSRFIDLITRVSLVFSISLLISNSIPDIDVNPFFSFLFQCVLSWSVALFLILTIGINKLEQQFIANKISTFIKKF